MNQMDSDLLTSVLAKQMIQFHDFIIAIVSHAPAIGDKNRSKLRTFFMKRDPVPKMEAVEAEKWGWIALPHRTGSTCSTLP